MLKTRWGFACLFLALMSVSCDTLGGPGFGLDQLRYDAAREQWERSGIEDYSYHVELSCFCFLVGEVVVQVRGGEATSAVRLDTGESVEVNPSTTPTVDELFDLIERGFDEEWHVIDVEYDDELGFPRRIIIDRRENVADDEASYVTQSLQSPPVLSLE